MLLKNANLHPYNTFTSNTADASPNDLGKWQLVAETALGWQSSAMRTLNDWVALVKEKPINLKVSKPRQSEMNLLSSFKTFQNLDSNGKS